MTGLFLFACQDEATLLLTVEGGDPAARALKVTLIDATGPVGETFSLPMQGATLKLPGTVLIRPGDGRNRLGIFAWAEADDGRALAHGRTTACVFLGSGAQARATVTLVAVSASWSPALARDCACDDAAPENDMCAGRAGQGGGGAGGAAGGQGGAGGTVASGGSGGGGGGSADTGGTAGSAGMGGVPATGGNPDGGMNPPADGGAPMGDPITNPIFSFENPADWTATGATATQDTTLKTHGASSLSLAPTDAKVIVKTRKFSASEAPGAATRLCLDVRLAQAPDFQTNLQLRITCPPAFYETYLGYRALGPNDLKLAANTWSRACFDPLPADVKAALAAQATNCELWLEFNGAGQVHLDNLGYVP